MSGSPARGLSPSRGEIWCFELPGVGRRPGCILTRQGAIPVLTSLLVAPATRTVRGIPTEVALGPGDGMPTKCALALVNVLPVRKALLTKRITQWGPDKLAELCVAVNTATGC